MTAFTFRDLAFVSGRRLLYPGYVQDYLDRVTAADVAAGNTLGLELGVTDAFNTCLQAMVADTSLGVSGGVLSQAASLIKASCFMMGARTLSGALVPLAADMPAPTNVGPFVGGDYNRRLGFTGDGATKYLNTNRAGNAEPPNNQSFSAYVTQLPTVGASIGGAGVSETGTTGLIATSAVSATRSQSATASSGGAALLQPFFGLSRSASASYTERANGANRAISIASQTPTSDNYFLFARSQFSVPTNYSNPRIAFYHVGRALDLAILDARITALSAAIQAAIAP